MKLIKKDIYNSAKKYNLHEEEINEMAIPSYTHKNPLVRWIFYHRIKQLENFVSFNDKTIFDFGCGVGLMFEAYSDSNKIFACDLKPEIAKEKSRELNLPVQFVNGIDEVADNSIDIFIFADVLEHISDLNSFLLIVFKKLKPWGKLLVSLPTESRIYKLCRTLAGYSKNPSYHRVNPLKIKQTLEKIFKLKRMKNIPPIFPLFNLMLLEKTS